MKTAMQEHLDYLQKDYNELEKQKTEEYYQQTFKSDE